MKVTESTVRQIEITEVPGLDPIRVILSDLGPGQGRINIECWGQSWANYWGGMGKDTISEFFSGCSEDYLAGKLSSIESNVFDPDALISTLKREVVKDRRHGFISSTEARNKFDAIEEIDFPSTADQLWLISDQMHEILGDEWWYSLPMKPNPDYQYLCQIIRTVKTALKGGAA